MERKYQFQPTLAILSYLRRKKKLRKSCELHSAGYELIKRPRPNHRTIECFPSHIPNHHINKGILTAVSFTLYIMLLSEKKLQAIPKGKAQNLKTEQALEPGMTRMLELSN